MFRGYSLLSNQVPRALIRFDDPKTAFKALKTSEVFRSWAILQAFTFKPIVKNSEVLYNMSKRVLGSNFTHRVISQTVFKHFCAGEDPNGIQPRIAELRKSGIGAILDYAAESDPTQASTVDSFDANVTVFENSIRVVHSLPGENFAAIKITGLASPALLEKLSATLPKPLPPQDAADLEKAVARLDRVCALASKLGVSVMIDAEWTTVQPAIDYLTISMMKKYNKERPVVSTTYQCYLKVTPQRIKADLEIAKGNFKLGAKLVRGAYLVSERTRSPGAVCDSFENTTAQFDAAINTLAAAPEAALVVVASHNTGSVRVALAAENFGKFRFAQLLGMRDNLTYPLAAAGVPVFKYIPYGPVPEVMPYLIRRAQENSSMFGSPAVAEERKMLAAELRKRLFGI